MRTCFKRLLGGVTFVLFSCLASADDLPSIDAIVQNIRQGQNRLLHAPGGISITYRNRVDQPADGPIAFREGQGIIRIKWPLLYSRFEAYFKGAGRLVREASYDFEKKHSTALEGKTEAVLAPYRHAWSANYLYPLRFCYFVQADQYYLLGQDLKTDKWLPNAIEQNSYTVQSGGTVDGVSCILLQRPGIDSLWLAPSRGYLVCRRELTFGEGSSLRERTINRNFREVMPGGWLPMTFMQEHYDQKTGRRTHTFHLEIKDVSIGSLSDQNLVVAIPKDVLQIDDQFRHMVARNPQHTRPFTTALAEARRQISGQRAKEWRGVRNWSILAAALGALLVVLLWKQRQRTH